jgi:hypothetical protein
MRPVFIGKPGIPDDPAAFRTWATQALAEIERASHDDIAQIAKDFTITGHTASRSLNAGTATAGQIANFLCTFIEDMQKRGMKRNR